MGRILRWRWVTPILRGVASALLGGTTDQLASFMRQEVPRLSLHLLLGVFTLGTLFFAGVELLRLIPYLLVANPSPLLIHGPSFGVMAGGSIFFLIKLKRYGRSFKERWRRQHKQRQHVWILRPLLEEMQRERRAFIVSVQERSLESDGS